MAVMAAGRAASHRPVRLLLAGEAEGGAAFAGDVQRFMAKVAIAAHRK